VEAGSLTLDTVHDYIQVLIVVLLILALLTAMVGSIGLAGTLSMNVLERTREIGILRAIGAYDFIVLRLVIVEGLIIGLISYILGALLSFPITNLLSNIISMAIFKSKGIFAFTIQGFVIWLVVVIILSILASVLPARNATRMTIREVLAYE
jgi:putative ABC transport system permease protein